MRVLPDYVSPEQVLSGENWNATMYSARRAVGWASTIYFASLIVLGMMIMMSLFLAILLSNFSTPAQEETVDEEKEEEEEEEEDGSAPQKERDQQQQQQPQGLVKAEQTEDPQDQDCISKRSASGEQVQERNTIGVNDVRNSDMHISNTSQLEEGSFRGARLHSDDRRDVSSPTIAAENALLQAQSVALSGRWNSIEGARLGSDGHGDGGSGSRSLSRNGSEEAMKETPRYHHDHRETRLWRTRNAEETPAHGSDTDSRTDEERNEDAEESRCSAVGKRIARYLSRAVHSVKVPDDLFPGLALCCLSAQNPLRRGCAAVVSNAGFHRFITFLIVVSSITLALDNPLRDQDSTTAKVLEIIEVVTAIFFTLEFLLKICATGFYFMPMAYLKDAWNILDFFVVIVVLVDFAAVGPSLVGLRSLRALRALRPLRYGEPNEHVLFIVPLLSLCTLRLCVFGAPVLVFVHS